MTSGGYSVLFVCTANRIRSVMAEAILREYLHEFDSGDEWSVASAGTWAADGLSPMPHAVRAMAERGIDIREHRSRAVDHMPLDSFNLILVMERGHKESLTWEFPAIADRVYLMSEMTGSSFDVADPVTGTLRDHAHTADMIQEMIVTGIDRIRELAAGRDADVGAGT